VAILKEAKEEENSRALVEMWSWFGRTCELGISHGIRFTTFSQMLAKCRRDLLFASMAIILPIRAYRGFGRDFYPLSPIQLPGLRVLLKRALYLTLSLSKAFSRYHGLSHAVASLGLICHLTLPQLCYF